MRVNSDKVSKSATPVGEGDTLTFPQARQIRVVRIADIGLRRGPAAEAQALYDDLTSEVEPAEKVPHFERKGRPEKRDRRLINKLKGK